MGFGWLGGRARLEQTYAVLLKDAFEGDAAGRAEFWRAADDTERGNVQSAMRRLEKLLPRCADVPSRRAVRMLMARLCEKVNLVQSAIIHYFAVLSAEPDYAEARRSIGILYPMVGQEEEGLLHLQRAVALEPDNAMGHYNLASLQLMLGAYAEAAESGERVLTCFAPPEQVHVLLYLVYAMLGQEDKRESHRVLALRTGVSESQLQATIQKLRANQPNS